ncbi:Ameloblastin, partial [Eschrichtius robustus]|nr:Ameloblastin [Eschrichtius robustus]
MDFADPQDPLNAPARLGIMSSEEMAGGRGGPMTYGAMFPGFGGMRPSLGGMPPNPAMGGDFTLEFDSPVAGTKGPEKGEGGAQPPPVPQATQPFRKTQLSFQSYHLVPSEGFLLILKAISPT